MKKTLFVLAIGSLALSQSFSTRHITIRVLNGKTGKPLSKVRVLAFAGSTREKVLFHEAWIDLRTDDLGNATLPFDPLRTRWIMPLVDFMTLCEADKNKDVFELSIVEASGGSSNNACGSYKEALRPGTLTIFAREPTFRERMAW